MTTTTLEQELETAVKSLEQFGDDLDAKGEVPSGEDLSELKNRMAAVKDIKDRLTADAEAKGTIADAKAFMAKLSGQADEEARKTLLASGLVVPQGKTFGEMFVESEGYKDFVGRFAKNGSIPNAVKNVQSAPVKLGGKVHDATADTKALLTGLSSTSAGALVVNDRYGPTVDLIGERELTVYDLVTKGSTDSDTVEYVRITGKTNNAATVAEATTAALPTQDGSTGPLVNAAGGGYKPESALALEVVSTTVKTLAHWIPVTKRAIADAGQIRTLIDAFLRYGLNEELEDQMLAGNGSGENFTGILNSSPQTTGSAGTDIDAIVDAIKKVRVTGRRRPNAVVFHPNDWFSTGFLLAKDSNGNYILGDPRASVEQLNQIWGLQVVVTEAMTENTALVGDFRQAVLWEREGIDVLVSDQHADFFTRNLLAILAEMRAAFGVLDPEAFCTVTAV